jgi:hypothetical protein
MMQRPEYRDYKLRKLSASEKGRGILVAASSSPGTLLHQALDSTAANEWDALTLRVVNLSSSPVKLTLEWGGTDAADQVELTIPAESGFSQVVDRHLLQDGAQVRAFAATANVLVVHGYVQRYEPNKP